MLNILIAAIDHGNQLEAMLQTPPPYLYNNVEAAVMFGMVTVKPWREMASN